MHKYTLNLLLVLLFYHQSVENWQDNIKGGCVLAEQSTAGDVQ